MFVINGLGTGGAERSLAEMLEPLRAQGIESVVAVLFRRQLGVEEEVLAAGWDVRFLQAGTSLGRVRELRRLISVVSPDVVHTTIFESDIAGRVAGWSARVPVVSSIVNTSYDESRFADPNVQGWKLRLVRSLDRLTSRLFVRQFHAITQVVKSAAVTDLRIPRERISVIPRGRRIEQLRDRCASVDRAEVRALLGLGERQRVLLNVGRQEFQKGQIHAVRAFAVLLERGLDVALIQAGRPGSATTELRAEVEKLGISDRVRFVDHWDDITQLLAVADIFIFPSVYEGLGGSLIEAMACGVPIVAANIAAIREVLDDGRCGLLLDVADTGALADACQTLLSDVALRSALVAEGARRAERDFSLGEVSMEMSRFYRAARGSRSHGVADR